VKEILFAAGRPPSALPAAGDETAWDPWWSTPYGRWRLDVEMDAMKRFPGFRLVESDGDLCWVGRIRSSLSSRRYNIRVRYPVAFPDSSPIVTIEKYRFPVGMPHLQGADKPCLFVPGEGSRYGYDPARTTAATFVAWTALWIHAYETWRETGRWPGREI